MSNEGFGGWLTKIKRWIKRLFQPRRKRYTPPKIIKRWYGKYCAVLHLERNTPGAIATYRITSLYGCDYLITLDYLPDLYGEVLGEHEGEIIQLGSNNYPNYPATHRFAVFRLGNNGSSHVIGIWDCDLQGSTFSYSLRELAPRRAVGGVALRCLRIPHNYKTPALTWESQIEKMNWLGLLEEKIRQELQNPYHELKACLVLVT